MKRRKNREKLIPNKQHTFEGLINNCLSIPLDLETTAGTTTTRSLELATLRTHERLRLAARSTGVTEVLVRLASSATTLEQNRVRSRGGAQSQLVERDALTASLQDASASSLREVQSAHLQSRNLHQTDIVRNGAHHHGDLILLALHVSGQSSETHRRTVDSAHIQTTENDLGELRTRATSHETVQLHHQPFTRTTKYLHQQSEVNVVALGSLTSLVSAVAASSNQVNTLQTDETGN